VISHPPATISRWLRAIHSARPQQYANPLAEYERVLTIIACLWTTACSGPEHPDPSRYEYRYINGAFVTPYSDFPEGRERGEWLCFDGKTKTAFDCTFVHGGWDQYKYIYRKRR
jgi:hypothetical protein